jgi:hypothetical protein
MVQELAGLLLKAESLTTLSRLSSKEELPDVLKKLLWVLQGVELGDVQADHQEQAWALFSTLAADVVRQLNTDSGVFNHRRDTWDFYGLLNVLDVSSSLGHVWVTCGHAWPPSASAQAFQLKLVGPSEEPPILALVVRVAETAILKLEGQEVEGRKQAVIVAAYCISLFSAVVRLPAQPGAWQPSLLWEA